MNDVCHCCGTTVSHDPDTGGIICDCIGGPVEPPTERPSLGGALASLLNSYSAENGSNTPDFILADYMLAALRAFERASKDREAWYGRSLHIGMGPEVSRALSRSAE